ncbi:MAG: 2-C-methyl-D-erythritol 4-phosphate cytidylyltransferase, partial [bacterium]
MKVGVVLVAGGRGVRLGARVPKAWVPLAGAPLFAHALSAFHDLPWVRRIAVVMEPAWVGRARNLLRALGSTKVSAVVAGGARRQDSVARGARALGVWGVDAVLIHDAARPFVDMTVAAEVAHQAVRHGAALA